MIQIWPGQCQWQFLIFQSGEDTDRELDCMLELPAARKPLNSPEEVALKSFLFWLWQCWRDLISSLVKGLWTLPLIHSPGSSVLELLLWKGGTLTSSLQVTSFFPNRNLRFLKSTCNTTLKQGMVEAKGPKNLQSSALHELPEAYWTHWRRRCEKVRFDLVTDQTNLILWPLTIHCLLWPLESAQFSN